MPFPFIAVGTALAGAAINYFGEKQKNDQAEEEMQRRRDSLEDAKYTSGEVKTGVSGIQRSYGGAIDSAANKFAFTSRGVQSPQAKGAMIGQMQGSMLSDVNRFVQGTTSHNKEIERQQALTGYVPQTSGLLSAGAGGIAGLQLGMQAQNYADQSGWFDDGPGMPEIGSVEATGEEMNLAGADTDVGNWQADANDLIDLAIYNDAEAPGAVSPYLADGGEVAVAVGADNPVLPETESIYEPPALAGPVTEGDTFPGMVYSGEGGDNPYNFDTPGMEFNRPQQAGGLNSFSSREDVVGDIRRDITDVGRSIGEFRDNINTVQPLPFQGGEVEAPPTFENSSGIGDFYDWMERNFNLGKEPKATKEELIDKYPTLGSPYSRWRGN